MNTTGLIRMGRTSKAHGHVAYKARVSDIGNLVVDMKQRDAARKGDVVRHAAQNFKGHFTGKIICNMA